MQPPPNYSQYPRPGQIGGGSGSGRGPGVYFEFISEGFQLMMRQAGVYLGGAALVIGSMVIAYFGFIISIFASNPDAFTNPNRASSSMNAIPLGVIFGFYGVIGVLAILMQVVCAGFSACAIEQADKGSTSFGTLFSAFRRIGPLVVCIFCCQFLSVIGMYACFVPGFYLFGVLAFAPILVIEEKLGPFEAMARSMAIIKPYAWSFAGLVFVLGLIASFSSCLLGVGFLFGLPLHYIVVGLHYREFRTNNQPVIGVPLG